MDDRALTRNGAGWRDQPPPTGSTCVDAETLAAWAQGAMPAAQSLAVETHLADCARCQAMAATFAALEEDAAGAAAHVAAGAAGAGMRGSARAPWIQRWWLPLAGGAIAATALIVMARNETGAPTTARVENTVARTEPGAGGAGGAAGAPRAQANAAAPDASASARAPQSNSVAAERAIAPPPSPPPPPPPAQIVAPQAAPMTGVVPPSARAEMRVLAEPPAPPAAPPPPPPPAQQPRALPAPPPPPAQMTVVDPATDLRAFRASRSTAPGMSVGGRESVIEFASPAITADRQNTPSVVGGIVGGVAGGVASGTGSGVGSGVLGGGGGRGGGGRGGGARTGASANGVPAPVAIVPASTITRWRIINQTAVERSTDNGASWTEMTLPNLSGLITTGVAPSRLVCWLIGPGGAIYRTTNGTDFTRIEFPERVDLVSILATDANTATITTAKGEKFETSDGKTWKGKTSGH